MHPLKKLYYNDHIIATVTLFDDGRFDIEGGRSDLRALERAKNETTFCFVKDLQTRKVVRLLLQDDQWIPEHFFTTT